MKSEAFPGCTTCSNYAAGQGKDQGLNLRHLNWNHPLDSGVSSISTGRKKRDSDTCWVLMAERKVIALVETEGSPEFCFEEKTKVALSWMLALLTPVESPKVRRLLHGNRRDIADPKETRE